MLASEPTRPPGLTDAMERRLIEQAKELRLWFIDAILIVAYNHECSASPCAFNSAPASERVRRAAAALRRWLDAEAEDGNDPLWISRWQSRAELLAVVGADA